MSDLKTLASKLKKSKDASLLPKAKVALLKANGLTPSPQTPKATLLAAREIYEAGALISIRNKDSEGFTRYVNQLQSFYELPEDVLPADNEEKNKITGLYLLLLLVKGDYAGFHTELEGLETLSVQVEKDQYLGYPVRLERWLMEGSYDKVWKALDGTVPSEEYAVFSEILIPRIRAEIASCSERAYPSLPVSSTKSLLFLDSDREVVQFAQSRGWSIGKDGRIYFPDLDGVAEGEVDAGLSQMAIENTLGYARELEMIV